MGARKETVLGYAKLDSLVVPSRAEVAGAKPVEAPAAPPPSLRPAASSAPPQAKQADSEAPKSGVRLVPPEARVPKAPPLPKIEAMPEPVAEAKALAAPIRFVPRRTLPTLPGGAHAPARSDSTPPPPSTRAKAPSSPPPPSVRPSAPPPPRPAPALAKELGEAPSAKKSVPPPLPKKAAVRPRIPRPGSAPLDPEKPVKSLVATAVDWPRVRGPQPSRPSFGPVIGEAPLVSSSALPPLRPPAGMEAVAVEPTALVVADEAPSVAPVALAVEAPVSPVVEAPPSADATVVVPEPTPSVADAPPCVIDVASPGLELVVDEEGELRAMRGRGRVGLFLALSLAALSAAAVLVLALSR